MISMTCVCCWMLSAKPAPPAYAALPLPSSLSAHRPFPFADSHLTVLCGAALPCAVCPSLPQLGHGVAHAVAPADLPHQGNSHSHLVRGCTAHQRQWIQQREDGDEEDEEDSWRTEDQHPRIRAPCARAHRHRQQMLQSTVSKERRDRGRTAVRAIVDGLDAGATSTGGKGASESGVVLPFLSCERAPPWVGLAGWSGAVGGVRVVNARTLLLLLRGSREAGGQGRTGDCVGLARRSLLRVQSLHEEIERTEGLATKSTLMPRTSFIRA